MNDNLRKAGTYACLVAMGIESRLVIPIEEHQSAIDAQPALAAEQEIHHEKHIPEREIALAIDQGATSSTVAATTTTAQPLPQRIVMVGGDDHAYYLANAIRQPMIYRARV
jgi:hypothetical protein